MDKTVGVFQADKRLMRRDSLRFLLEYVRVTIAWALHKQRYRRRALGEHTMQRGATG
jgi:hypothetical protein